MKVKMLKTELGSPNGIRVNEYEEGETYDLPESLAQNFLDRKPPVAKIVKVVVNKPPETKPAEIPETKTKEEPTKE